MVRSLSAVGTRFEDIAAKLGITHDTLAKWYRSELDAGRIDANAAIASTLYNKAKSGDTAAMIFWLKTRAGWREKSDVNITNDDRSLAMPTRIEIVAVAASQRRDSLPDDGEGER